MTSYRRWSTTVTSALWLVLTAAIWIALAPVQMGGSAAYVIVNGNSMEPNFHIGDLVIVRPASSYSIGDRIVYQNPNLGSNVFHRIVDLEFDHYILKGDNNSWIDSYHPTREEVIGRLWAHLPQFGIAIQYMRRPVIMALIIGGLGSLLAISIGNRQSKGKRRMKNKTLQELLSKARKQNFRDWVSGLADSGFIKALRKRTFNRNVKEPESLPAGNPDPNKYNPGGLTEGFVFVLGLLAFGAIILGIFAFTRPATRVVPDNILYQHLGIFTYTATAPDSVYDSGTLQSGQPIFPKTTCVIDINFQYTLVGDQEADIAGSYKMSAIVTEPLSGWQRIIPLYSEAPFTGNSYGARANLDLCQVITLIEAMEGETGFRPGSYTLIITPQVTITGLISGKELNDTFEPNLIFRYDRTHFYLINENTETDPLNPTETRLLQEEHQEPNVLSIFGLEPKVPFLRFASLLVLGLCLGSIVMLGLQIQNLARNDRPAFLRMKYDALIVDIKGEGIDASPHTIDVSSIDDLAKLAERYNVMILHHAHEHIHAYYVQGDGITYRYMDEAPVKQETMK